MCAAKKQSNGRTSAEGEKQSPQGSQRSKTTTQKGVAPTATTQAPGNRVPRRMASEEEQREFASKYKAELIISFVGSKPSV